ncbi:hypothetical protein BH11PAT3_BH11PAT3_2610 [soil metagenome]
MQKKTYISIGVIIALIALGGFALYKKRAEAPLVSSTPAEVFAASDTLIKTDADKALAHEVWMTFSKYLTFAKAHDLVGIKTIAYKISPTCADTTKTKECYSLMDDLSSLGAIFEEKQFTHISYDSKNILLSTDYKLEENQQIRGYSHAVLYFIRADDGSLKIVGFGPAQGRYLAKLPDQTSNSLNTLLAARLVDSDKDGVADFVELCTEPSPGETCTKTDPLNKDTNKNGLWDSIDLFLK